jgi:putative transposase
MPDHVHLLIDCNPRFGIVKCVKEVKGRTSHILREEFPELKRKLPTLWTRSSFISSCGAVSLETVMKYIENQKNV